MPISAVIGGGAALLGGILGGNAARDAANTSAAAQRYAAEQAAAAARFRPVGVTTRFGTSNFQFNPEGYLSSAGYTVSPELQAYQNRLMGLAGTGLTQAEQAQGQFAPLTGAAQGLFNLGQQYIAQSPEQVAQDYISKQQALLAPGRERESAQLLNQLSNTGRTGLSIAQGGGLSAANPEFAALANARAMQDLQLAAQAQQAGQQQTAFGAGLFGTGAGLLGNYYSGQVGALSPFQTNLGLTSTIEQLGQSPLDIGAQLGGKTATAGANVGQSLLAGGVSAARAAQAGNQNSPFGDLITGLGSNRQFTQGVANWMRGVGPGGGITSPDMGVWGYNDVYGGGTLPMSYANL
jgi:hypothetical protein